MRQEFYVNATWDPEASVWISESDIPGLVIEADTLAEFEHLMLELAPEMLAVNEVGHPGAVTLMFSARSERTLAVV